MAHITTPPAHHPPGEGPEVRQPGPKERRRALGVLLTGRDAPDQPAIDHFENFARNHGLPLDGLWAAYEGQTTIYSALIVPGSGRTAVLFVAQVPAGLPDDLPARLIRTVVGAQSAAETRIIQTLLEPEHHREEKTLADAGFTRLASLVYMRRSCLSDPPADPESSSIICDDKPLTRLAWEEANRDAFAAAIDVSYQDTLDCPGLVGVREPRDIIAGHMAVGRFDPALWSAYYDGDEPAAVLLLNPLIDRTELELVYLGLAPRYRGKGLGARLMRSAFAQASTRHDSGIHLAVDQGNAPAMKLYQSLGFRATSRKTAMIEVLK